MGAYDISHFRAVPSSAGYGAGGFAARSVEVELCCGGSFVSSSLLSFPSPPLGLDESREKSLIKKRRGRGKKIFSKRREERPKLNFYRTTPPHAVDHTSLAHSNARARKQARVLIQAIRPPAPCARAPRSGHRRRLVAASIRLRSG